MTAPRMMSTTGSRMWPQRGLRFLVELNPMCPMLSGYANLLQDEAYPPMWMWLAAAAWAMGTVVVGFMFFISREREFAVRLT